MGKPAFVKIRSENAAAEEAEEKEAMERSGGGGGGGGVAEEPPLLLRSPVGWFRTLCEQIHWSVVVGVVFTYGVNQGIGGGFYRVASDYYWKDVQKLQPSVTQVYQGIKSIPWIVKPIWGLFTDIVPVLGYHRRPYFLMAGLLGFLSMFIVSVHGNLHAFLALVLMTSESAGVAIADVTIDACVANNCIKFPSLAADLQSLCGLSSSVGGLFGYSISGILVNLMGPQGVLGLLCISFVLVFSVGIMLEEARISNFDYGQVHHKLMEASGKMVRTLKCPQVWRPCLYMYISTAISLDTHEGFFYWYTDPKAGPAFSEKVVGFIYSIGSVGSLLGVLLYQNLLKDHPFRTLLFWTQLLYSCSGMLDIVFVKRLNLKIGVPDYVFVVIDTGISFMVNRIKWLPILVLSSKLCPRGIEGTFFALLMSIDNAGLLTASWGGGLLLHALKVTRTDFTNLWLSLLIRNLMRLLPLALLFLIPKTDQNANVLPSEILEMDEPPKEIEENNVEMIALVNENPTIGESPEDVGGNNVETASLVNHKT